DNGLLESTDIPQALIHPTPNDPPWNSVVAGGVWLMSVIFVVFVPMIFVAPYALSRGIDFSDQGVLRAFLMTDPTAVILQLAPIIFAHALTLFVAWFVVTKFNTYSFRQTLGWRMNGFKVWHCYVITLLFFVIVAP